VNISYFDFKLKKYITLLCLIAIYHVGIAQNNADQPNKGGFIGWVKRVYTEDHSSPEKPKYLVYPTFAYSPETSLEIGVSALNLFYANRDTSNRLSEIQSFSFFTLNSQYGSFLEHFIYTDKDKWFLLGKLKAQRFPLLYYGIGNNAKKIDEQLIASDYIAIRERILRKISNNFFGGLNFDYQKVSKIHIEHPKENAGLIPGIQGSKNIGLGLGLVYDTRHNALNVRDGIFAEVANLSYSPKFGSKYNFNTTSVDFRYFKSTAKNQVLATQFVGQFTSGKAPFNMMSLLGNENIMRGYYYGRYRDNNLIAAQVEYRFLPFSFSKRFGAAAFFSAGAVSSKIQNFSLNKLLPAGGVGIRYLIFPKKDIFVRLDVGFTKEGRAFYIFTGESF
jgi:hypothetical protein